MKRLLSIICASILVLSLAACGVDSTTGTNGGTTVAPPGARMPDTNLPAPVKTEAAAPEAAAAAPAAEQAVQVIEQAAAEYPILVTSGGQSADYQMISTVMGKKGMDYTTNNLATSADLGDAKTLIVVVGGSSKGLGAAGIDANGELARLTELLDGAKAAGLKIITMHTGGSARRGDLSDKFIKPVFEYADYAI
ncbi:MAG: hypothetical protein J6P87_05200, partial [Lachnospiraceae bacterium]|nr:hypothetical protein [Lachnospiraceae bacterium]